MPKVKPLVWRKHNEIVNLWESIGGDGWCRNIRGEAGHFILEQTFPEEKERVFGGFEDAKAAAQADYEARVLSQIEMAPVTVQEAARPSAGSVAAGMRLGQAAVALAGSADRA